MAVAKAHFEPLMAAMHLGVTLQIDVGAEVFDAKHSSLHPLFNKALTDPCCHQDTIAQLARELYDARKSRTQVRHFSKRFPEMTHRGRLRDPARLGRSSSWPTAAPSRAARSA